MKGITTELQRIDEDNDNYESMEVDEDTPESAPGAILKVEQAESAGGLLLDKDLGDGDLLDEKDLKSTFLNTPIIVIANRSSSSLYMVTTINSSV